MTLGISRPWISTHSIQALAIAEASFSALGSVLRSISSIRAVWRWFWSFPFTGGRCLVC
ncbi:hypothetical protein [Klebsiella electrica]|uniref:hypothetical protein n=1 Tax=Klebsiella electrica TaxID=1259973 RepID=UPI0019259DAB